MLARLIDAAHARLARAVCPPEDLAVLVAGAWDRDDAFWRSLPAPAPAAARRAT